MELLLKIIKEEIDLFELGEINLPSYPFTLDNGNYYFDVDDDKYEVLFKKFLNSDYGYDVTFKTINNLHSFDTNKNKQYKIMSTIITILKNFIEKNKPLAIGFSGSKTKGSNDNRRINMYNAYVSKNFVNTEYELKIIDSNNSILRKKYNNNIKKLFQSINNRMKQELLVIYPELNIKDKWYKNIFNENKLYEVGEANLPSYPYTLKNTTSYKREYFFTTDDNDDYIVTFDHSSTLIWEIYFKANTYFDATLNKKSMYRVMSTITEIVKSFADETNPMMLIFSGVKTKGENDERRNKLYIAYIYKHINDNYKLVKNNENYDYVIILNDEHKLINTFMESSVSDRRDILYIYPFFFKNMNPDVLNNLTSSEKNVISIYDPYLEI